MLVRNRVYNQHTYQGVFLGMLPADERDSSNEKASAQEPLWYTGEGALVTIAPPGAGKGQAQIIPNLLTYRGPSIVLDIKGENYDLTHRWREQTVGPVFKFAPFSADSHSYNPLDFMEHKNPDKMWDDARLMASMLMVQSGKRDFWDNRAEDILAAIIAHTKQSRPAHEQNMQSVLDDLYPTKTELEIFAGEMQNSPIRALRRSGNVLSTMPEKQREGIFDSARQHVEIWQSGRIEKITERTDWLPMDFWQPPWKTLYISVPVGQVSTYASVLRVLIGQHIKGLIDSAPSREEREEQGIPPILLLLDEMPQLGYMEPIPYSIEVGRSAGLRTWMFAQSIGQLRKTYPDADGLIEMCYVQCFMNPEFDTAKRLSERLGSKESLLRGTKERVAEPQELMGEDYSEQIVTFVRGHKPARLNKLYAFQDTTMVNRMQR